MVTTRSQEVAQHLRALVALRTIQVWFPAPTWWLTSSVTPVPGHSLLISVGIRHAYGPHTFTKAKQSYV